MSKVDDGEQHRARRLQSAQEFQLRVVTCGEETMKLDLGAGPSHQMRALDTGLWAVFKLLGSL